MSVGLTADDSAFGVKSVQTGTKGTQVDQISIERVTAVKPIGPGEEQPVGGSWLAHRYGGVVLWLGLMIAISTLIRIVLLVHARAEVDWHGWRVPGVFFWGFLFDLSAATLAALPLHLYLWWAPKRWLAGRLHRWLMAFIFLGVLYGLLFGAVAEWFFWEEFQARFNFIAVDYLIYTTEVIGNIRESYPLPGILSGLALVTALVAALLWRTGWWQTWMKFGPRDAGGGRLAIGLGGLMVVAAGGYGLSNRKAPDFGNAYNQELARNGLYSFVAAYRENELSYERYYPGGPASRMLRDLRPLLQEPDGRFVSEDPLDITRQITAAGPERRWNVIQITVESLSAKYLGVLGNRHGLTPNLDRLWSEALVFTNLYATGTRTVRGMEALTLSLPPTPGQSIVRRPRNEHLFSLGSVFAGRGYDTAFLYSGHGYFDNMNAFFAANGYRVIDRASVAASDITFATVWGACDEDLYRWTLREADAAFARGQPFHHFLMTTSNHRPFAYPTNRIDLAPGHRNGAVKYTDYAIGRFIEQARQRPWFTNTLFVIVADHCASAAGKTALPVPGYHIPALIWNPSLIPPREVGALCSQIDLPPTLLGVLSWSYESRFFGKDILRMQPGDGRAFISTYQKLGYLRAGWLSVLEPVRHERAFRLDGLTGEWVPTPPNRERLDEAEALYGGASYLFAHGLNQARRTVPVAGSSR